MKNILALVLVGAMSTASVAEDFLGDTPKEENFLEPKPKEQPFASSDEWNSKKWRVYKSGTECLFSINWTEDPETKKYSWDDSDIMTFSFSLFPLGDDPNFFMIGSHKYDKLTPNSPIKGSVIFDNAKSLKVKFIVDGSEPIMDRFMKMNNPNLDLLRLVASSNSLEIQLDGVDSITMDLEGSAEAYEALKICYEKIRE